MPSCEAVLRDNRRLAILFHSLASIVHQIFRLYDTAVLNQTSDDQTLINFEGIPLSISSPFLIDYEVKCSNSGSIYRVTLNRQVLANPDSSTSCR